MIITLLLSVIFSYSQKIDSTVNNLQNLPDKYFSKVDSKISSVDDKVVKQTAKYLKKLQKEESKIKNKLSKVDSVAAKQIGNGEEKFKAFSDKIKNKTAVISKVAGGQYSSYLDSLGTSLSFLKQFNNLSDKVKETLLLAYKKYSGITTNCIPAQLYA